MANEVLGVVGGSGGVGASSFAAVLAAAALPAALVDVDEVGGGVDVLLGIEAQPGARWSGLRVDGGRLDPRLLWDGLPRWRGVAVLAVDAAPPSPAALTQVVEAAVQRGTVVLDLPRAASPLRDAGLQLCTLCVVVVSATIREVAAARAVLRSLTGVPAGVVVRRGELPLEDATALLGAPVLGVLPGAGRDAATPARVPRAATQVAAGLLDGLAA